MVIPSNWYPFVSASRVPRPLNQCWDFHLSAEDTLLARSVTAGLGGLLCLEVGLGISLTVCQPGILEGNL